MSDVSPDRLALQRLYHWERTAPDRVTLTQPMGGGALQDYTWKRVADETRRMAAYLRSFGFPPGIAHRDPVEELRALADERPRDLDGRPRLGAAVPDAHRADDPPDPRAQRVASCCSSASSTASSDGARHPAPACRASATRCRRPTATRPWDHMMRTTAAAAGRAGARRRRARHADVHVGHDRQPEGRDAQLRQLRRRGRRAGCSACRSDATIACCRTCRCRTWPSACSVEHGWLATGLHVYFAEVARHLRARPAACAAHHVLLGAAPVGQVPAGRALEDAAGQTAAAAVDPDPRQDRAQEGARGRSASISAASPSAAPRRCRPICCAGTNASACRSSRATA